MSSSPIFLLPFELLADIFLLSVSRTSWFYMPSYKKSVLLPGQVCRQWREVALSTPKMWRKIGHYWTKKKEADHALALTSTWLVRSGGCSLVIWLMTDKGCEVGMHSIIDIIVNHSERWEDVKFVIPNSIMSHLSNARCHINRLEKLCLMVTRDQAMETLPMNTFEVAPLLHTLSLEHFLPLSYLKFPVHQFTKFSIKTNTSDECLEWLQRLTMVQEFELSIASTNMILPVFPVIEHFHLRELDVLMTSDSNLGWFFDHLRLPVLQKFHYHETSGTWALSQFITFLSRSAPPLRTMHLYFKQSLLSGDDLVEILLLTPNLVELKLKRNAALAVTKMVWARLSPRVLDSGQIMCLVPMLQKFAVQRFHDFDDLACVDMIQSRWRLGHPPNELVPVSQIEAVKLLSWAQTKLHPVALIRLKEFREEGLDIFIEDEEKEA